MCVCVRARENGHLWNQGRNIGSVSAHFLPLPLFCTLRPVSLRELLFRMAPDAGPSKPARLLVATDANPFQLKIHFLFAATSHFWP